MISTSCAGVRSVRMSRSTFGDSFRAPRPFSEIGSDTSTRNLDMGGHLLFLQIGFLSGTDTCAELDRGAGLQQGDLQSGDRLQQVDRGREANVADAEDLAYQMLLAACDADSFT